MTTLIRKKPRPVQKGNPHNLTVKQHIFPRKGLQRFAMEDVVRVRLIGKQEPIFCKTGDTLFCANRAWDQRSEVFHSRDIEVDFAQLTDKLISGEVRKLDSAMNLIATDFYDLMDERYKAHITPYEDETFVGISANDLSLDEQELLESKGIMFVGPEGTMSGRTIAGIHMMGRRMYRRRIDVPLWGIWHAQGGEFIVPDNFSENMCIPVSPSIWLMAEKGSLTLNFREVAQLNAFHLYRAHRYAFARDFDFAPVYRRTAVGFVMMPDLGDGHWLRTRG
ncbi:hypothetical protein C798_25325 [Herbaspirillum rubrisubalbicans Os34]|uniref:DUF4238 domain-containing protein n=1 Tax=Herbaspirillum rubrisubalbicans Os34 TaxID=1235827 RepID=A0A6M3ZY56_9BURK|nr:hypothetical protein [Herbaspirillum rubrisubalbicans]QJQ03436.1 hypothetical protein C798_25325 [Herbaspirillum rubrisubalbicans Os34]